VTGYWEQDIAPPVAQYVAPKVVDSIPVPEKLTDLTIDSLPGALTGQETINGSGKGTGKVSDGGDEGGGGNGVGGNGLYSAVDEMPKFRGAISTSFANGSRRRLNILKWLLLTVYREEFMLHLL